MGNISISKSGALTSIGAKGGKGVFKVLGSHKILTFQLDNLLILAC